MLRIFPRIRRVSRITRGDQARAASEWLEAARHYRAALARNPENWPIWVQYGHALKESGRLAEAETAYRRSLSGCSAADTHLQLGHVLKLQGRVEEAQTAYLCAVAHDPALQDARCELAEFGWSDNHLQNLAVTLGAHTGKQGVAPTAQHKALRQRLMESGLFDPAFYRVQNPDIAEAGVDPLDHYIDHGASEGRDPSANFNTKAYTEIFPIAAGNNPLLHYLEHGRDDPRSLPAVRLPAPRPAAIPMADWTALAGRIGAMPTAESQVDIIIPVYRGVDETAGCLFAAISSRLAAETAVEIIVIDDCSPEPALRHLLEELAGLGLFSLLRNETNLGFVGTVNRGMALHHDRDVVLLNSDAEVYGDWIDRLRGARDASPTVGTITPFSNNATICSYPELCRDFQAEFEIPFTEIDRLASRVNRGQIVDIPTGVGFCMYIRRECLSEAGLFDIANFEAGYGEENDFCLRIAAKGWRNVLAGDVFVRHFGHISFGASAWQREQNAIRVMNHLHPSYVGTIASFCRRDPIEPLRRRLDIARLRHDRGDRAIMMVSHDRGGGTEKHVQDLCARLEAAGIASYVVQPSRCDAGRAEIVHPRLRDTPNIGDIDVRHGLADAAELCRELGVFHLHIQHLSGFERDALHFFPALCRELDIDYDFTFHDYLAVCPRINMIDANGVFCDSGDLITCEQCVRESGSPFGDVGVGAWRAGYERVLRGARRLFAPDEDTAQRLRRLVPGLDIAVRPHPDPVPEMCGKPMPRRRGEELRVAVIGAIGPHKGSQQLQRYAEDAARRRLPITFVLFGYTDIPGLMDLPNVEVTGQYEASELQSLLARRPCHLALFASVWPETYCYALSEALFAGLFPVAFDLGAPARRIRACGWGRVLPFATINQPGVVNDALLSCEVPAMPERVWRPVIGAYDDIIADYYELDGPVSDPARVIPLATVNARTADLAPECVQQERRRTV